eukprot:scaffold7349_cov173-Amphora_coffeaeformis.AAC.135
MFAVRCLTTIFCDNIRRGSLLEESGGNGASSLRTVVGQTGGRARRPWCNRPLILTIVEDPPSAPLDAIIVLLLSLLRLYALL